MDDLLKHLVTASCYAVLGVTIFGLAFWAMGKVAPFSIKKEIAEDQNTALGIVMGAVILGLAIIVAAAVAG